ncbi:PrsW family intramembrane metalloprotease [Streptococcus suis]|nr:PrsW family intramembrane metalloprotease [Streptococcus suis]
MKHLWNTSKSQFALVLASLGFVSGCKIIFDELAKPNGMEEKYPLFLLTISLVVLYLLPLLVLIRYLEKRYAISKKVSHLSWLLGMTAGVAFSDIGHTAIGYFLLEIVKVSDDFRYDWGAAISGPLAEEIGKGLTVLLVLLICRRMTLKHALVSGMIAGLSFQIVEDIMFTFRDMFIGKLDGFETIIGRVGQAGWTHWVFTMLFAIGLVALLTKNTGMSKAQGVFWIGASFGIHFLFNSPFNTGIFQTVFPILSILLGLLAYQTVEKLSE